MTRDLNVSIPGSGSLIEGIRKMARGYWWRVEALLRRVWSGDFPRPRTLLAHWLVGATALGATTAVCFSVGLNPGAVALNCEGFQLVSPRIPGFRKAMAQKHKRAGASLGDVHADAVGFDQAVIDLEH